MNNPYINTLPGVPSVESPFFKKIFAAQNLDAETIRIANDLNKNGYAILDFPDENFDEIAANIKDDLHDQYNWEKWRNVEFDRGIGMRTIDSWKTSQAVHDLAKNQKIINLLSVLFGRQAWPFQTLNFPVGTQQNFHTDSVHFSSVPERFMCGLWTALEDIHEDAGPLFYYPGSHKWPIYVNEHLNICSAEETERVHQNTFEPVWQELVDTHDAKPEIFLPKKGQSVIWLSNLLHGGSRQTNKERTRWSQVTHFYFEDCAYYTPMHSDPFYGNIQFRNLTNLANGEQVKNKYANREIPQNFIDQARRGFNAVTPSLPVDFDPALYLAANPDLAAAGVDASEHYLNHGWHEQRRLRP